MNVAAEFYLYRTLARIKSIATAPSFPEDVLEKGKGPSPFHADRASTAVANVTARLYKSSPVKGVMADVEEKVRGVLGVRPGEGNGKVKNKRLQIAEHDRGTRSKAEAEALSSADERPEGRRAMSVGSVAASDDLGQYEARIAGSSSEEHSDDEDYASAKEMLSTSKQRTSDDDAAFELGREPKNTQNREPTSPTLPQKKQSTVKREKDHEAPVKDTTFLPSLAMGGYWSGSESAPNTSDEEAAKIRPRRNRMGQQARQALWEKKFGSRAKHVRKQQQNRDAGWDARKGAQPYEEEMLSLRRDGVMPRSRGSARQPLPPPPPPTGANGDPVNRKSRKPASEAAAKLHPSWEAAKKLKEGEKTAAFQGKKVVFD